MINFESSVISFTNSKSSSYINSLEKKIAPSFYSYSKLNSMVFLFVTSLALIRLSAKDPEIEFIASAIYSFYAIKLNDPTPVLHLVKLVQTNGL